MTAVNPAGWLQNAGSTHTAAQLRSYASGLISGKATTSTTLIPRGGVNPVLGGLLNVTQTGSPSMAVIVASGLAYVPGTQNAVQGCYVVQNDGDVTISLTAAHGSLARIDIVVAQVEDAFYAGSINAWKLAVVDGTPAGSPVAPSAPANSIILAHVAVGAGVSSVSNANITDKRFFAAGMGGVITTKSANVPTVGTLPNGQLVYLQDSSPRRLDIVDNGAYANIIDFMSLRTLVARKTVSESVTNSGAFQDDDHITFTVVANAVYLIDSCIIHLGPDGSNVGEILWRWTMPSGSRVDWALVAPSWATPSGLIGDANWQGYANETASPTSSVLIGTSSGFQFAAFKGTLAVGGTGGTFKAQWCQNALSATACTVDQGSWVTLKRVP